MDERRPARTRRSDVRAGLGILSDAANKELPKHLASTPGGAHSIIVPAFVRGVGPRLYSIDNVVDRKTRRHWYRYTSYQRTAELGSSPPRVALGGTGGIYLAQKDRQWQRALVSLVNAHDRGKVSDYLIADHLARLSYEAYQGVRDGTVGPRCIVVWRRRPDPRRPASGGAHQFYTSVERDQGSDAIPTIANGMDIKSLVGVLMPRFLTQSADHGFGASLATSDEERTELNRLLAMLPSEPDEKLR
jgi:hypothetical protein